MAPATPAAPAPQTTRPKPAAATPPVTPKKASAPTKTKSPPPQPRAPSLGSTTSLPFGASTTSLQSEKTAQSAHKYLQTEGLAGGKQKVKTRGAVGHLGNLDGIPEKEKGKKNRFWSAFAKKDKGRDVKNTEESDEEDEEDEEAKKERKKGVFAGLSRRTSELMHQLLRTSEDKKQGLADMRWEKFVKVRACGYMRGLCALCGTRELMVIHWFASSWRIWVSPTSRARLAQECGLTPRTRGIV